MQTRSVRTSRLITALALMILISMLPVGLMQAWASVEYGTWFARSAEFMQSPVVNRLRWMRMFGDTIFAVGAITYVLFVLGLSTGHSYRPQRHEGADLDPLYAPVRGA